MLRWLCGLCVIVLLSISAMTAAQEDSEQRIGDDLVNLALPLSVAPTGQISVSPDSHPKDNPDAEFFSLLPEHYLVKLTNAKKQLIGVVRIFRTADYAAYFPSSIPMLQDVLVQRDSAALPDPGTLLLVNSVYTFRALESFIAMPDGGTAWRMVAGYPSKPAINNGNMAYVVLGLSEDEYYFYQIFINMLYTDLDTAPRIDTPTWQEVADDLADRVLPNLADAEPGDFEPSLTDLDAFTMSLNIAADALPARSDSEPFTPILVEPQDTLATLTGMIPQVDPVDPSQSAESVTCPGFLTSRLVVGQQGRVVPGDPNNVRAAPDPDGVKMGQIPGGATFDVLEGPQCGNNGAWWRIHYNDFGGWTLEGQGSDYWLEPVDN